MAFFSENNADRRASKHCITTPWCDCGLNSIYPPAFFFSSPRDRWHSDRLKVGILMKILRPAMHAANCDCVSHAKGSWNIRARITLLMKRLQVKRFQTFDWAPNCFRGIFECRMLHERVKVAQRTFHDTFFRFALFEARSKWKKLEKRFHVHLVSFPFQLYE